MSIGVLIVPTGIGAEIGGHAGDANPVAKLLASVCDTLIVHPNVVNASDINEMPANCLYVEGSILDRFLEGAIRLRPVKANKVLVAVNPPLLPETVNAVSAARVTIGLDAEIVVLETPLRLRGWIEDGRAMGDVEGSRALIDQVASYEFDALAIATKIDVDKETAYNYLRHGGSNPWGFVEAVASRVIAHALAKPVAHAPVDSGLFNDFNEVVDPRLSAETVSVCYLHSVLKGLHQAPRIDFATGFSVAEISWLVTPWGCVGRPHRSCLDAGIPVIAVRENRTCLDDPMPAEFLAAENYLEAAGLIAAMGIGITPASVRRPIGPTVIHE